MSDAQTDALFAAYAEPGAPGAAVLVVHGSKARMRAYGVAEIETGRAVTPTTCFRLASLTMQFTATAVLILEKEGYCDVSGQEGSGDRPDQPDRR